MHNAENSKKTVRPFIRSNGGKWLLHLAAFAIFQIIFMLTDGSRFWNLLHLNKVGEKVVAFLHPFFDHFQLYTSIHLNYVTAVWGMVVVLQGIISLVEWLLAKKSRGPR